MPVLAGLLQRWGFVKLRSYGLELTGDGRIVSTRSTVLNDGTGAKIVGWRDGDVSIWKLNEWDEAPAPAPVTVTGGAARPGSSGDPVAEASVAAPAFVAPPVAAPPPVAVSLPVPAPLPVAAPPVAASPVVVQAPAVPALFTMSPVVPALAGLAPSRPSASVIPTEVAAEPAVDEDDWEWTIALARARVAVDEAESARPPEPAPRLDPSRIIRIESDRPTERPIERPARPIERPTPRVAISIKDLDIDDDDVHSRPTRPAVAIPRTEPVAQVATPRATVIPVPALPTVASMTVTSRMEPVVRTSQAQQAAAAAAAAAAARFAKGTGPVDPPSTEKLPALLVEDTIPDFSVGDRTRPGVAVAPRTEGPSNGDRTKPGIVLPPAARAVELPSIKRRMQQR